MIKATNGSSKKSTNKAGSTKGTSKTLSGPAMYTKVSQATIDKIKSQGMKASLAKAATSKNAEFLQGVKRMYGADRLKAAISSAKPSTAGMGRASKGSMTKPKSGTPGAISGKSKSNAPGAISGKKVSTTSTSSKPSTTKKNTRFIPGSIADNIANNRGFFGNAKK